jgi:hypothetical protein
MSVALPPALRMNRSLPRTSSKLLSIQLLSIQLLSIQLLSIQLGTSVQLDRAGRHPDTQEPTTRIRQQYIPFPTHGSMQNLLQENRRDQCQRANGSCRTRSSANLHARDDKNGEPKDDFETIQDRVGFGAGELTEAGVVFG